MTTERINRTGLAIAILTAGLFSQCESVRSSETHRPMQQDPHSYSVAAEARVTHLQWKADIDFTSRRIAASATWRFESAPGARRIIFDTKDLAIESVTVNGTRVDFRLGERDSLFGQPLEVPLGEGAETVTIAYRTSSEAEALQWLDASQTAGKVHPFMFTQSQAILARSWIPCQDSPGIRFTYEAEVSVPTEFIALMSASNPQERNSSGRYQFKMEQPIPSYLLALTVGDIAFKPISQRAGVYAEPSILEKAAWEFADLEKMVAGAESLYGQYRWDRYDVIVLPPSFPFGGMENPRLTFATPTILAGDRSLTSLIAHELAHSWSGNLVTNGSWDDFWLNEGFTVYFEHRIMEKLYGRDYSEMLATLALDDLKGTIEDLKEQNKFSDTRLKLDLAGRNPDDGVTDIAYNKGYFFLRLIEETHGREKFDAFLKDYFAHNAFTSMDTDRFIDYIKRYYDDNFRIKLGDAVFQSWIFTEGLPLNCPAPTSGRFASPENAIAKWLGGVALTKSTTRDWSTHEWLHFLKRLPASMSFSQMAELDDFGNFTASGNAEILTLWLVHAIRNNYEPAYAKLEEFLVGVGRRKFLLPLYSELSKTPTGLEKARGIYRKARPNYHFVARNSFDAMLGV